MPQLEALTAFLNGNYVAYVVLPLDSYGAWQLTIASTIDASALEELLAFTRGQSSRLQSTATGIVIEGEK